MTAQKVILHPTDFSTGTAKAFEVAGSLARDRSARLLVLHVAPRPLTTLGGTAAVPPSRDEFDLEERRRQLAKIRPPEGVVMDTRLEVGEEAERILAVARASGCEMIVMGTHGRSGISRVLLGSVAEKVLRSAPCPVLTLRPEPAKG